MSPTTPMAPDGVPGGVVDRRRDARLAEHRLVALAGQAGLADILELLAQRGPLSVRWVSLTSGSAMRSSTTLAGA